MASVGIPNVTTAIGADRGCAATNLKNPTDGMRAFGCACGVRAGYLRISGH